MGKYHEDLARIITLESGKPLGESRGEVLYAQSFYDFYAEEARRFSGEVLQPPVKGRRMLSLKQPVGPAGFITPWNFPSAMITRKVGPALAAGCTVVIKPSEETPLSALALCVIAQEAGLPPGVMNCLTVGREEVTDVGLSMCHNQDLRKVRVGLIAHWVFGVVFGVNIFCLMTNLSPSRYLSLDPQLWGSG